MGRKRGTQVNALAAVEPSRQPPTANPVALLHAPAPLALEVEAARAARAQQLAELGGILRLLLRPDAAHATRWTGLRRALRLAGYRPVSDELTLALLDLFPGARLTRFGTRRRGPRCVEGVRMVIDLDRLRLAIRGRWEGRLQSEGMPEEPRLTPTEMKAGLHEIRRSAHGSRLHLLVEQLHARRDHAGWYFERALQYLRTASWAQFPPVHRKIWALHCEGATKGEIATETGTPPTTAQAVLDRHRARAGLTHR